MPIVLKSRSLNLLELLGPIQAYNGIALPLTLPLPLPCLVGVFQLFMLQQRDQRARNSNGRIKCTGKATPIRTMQG